MNDDLRKEIIQIHIDAHKTASKQTLELLKAYRRNLDDVRKQIGDIYLKYTVDGKLNISSQQRYSALIDLERQLAKQMKDLSELNVETTTNILTDVYKESFYKTAYTIDKGIKFSSNFTILKPEFVKVAVNTPIEGKLFSQRIWNNTETLAKRVKSDVEKALIQGTSPEKLARQIKNDFGVSAYQAKRLINNEVSRVVSMAQDEIYTINDAVEKVLFDAVLDKKTSDICQGLDGQYFSKDKAPKIPTETHVGCRSCFIPVVSGWKPTKKLENITDPETHNKKVIDYTTYEKWKKSYGLNEVKDAGQI